MTSRQERSAEWRKGYLEGCLTSTETGVKMADADVEDLRDGDVLDARANQIMQELRYLRVENVLLTAIAEAFERLRSAADERGLKLLPIGAFAEILKEHNLWQDWVARRDRNYDRSFEAELGGISRQTGCERCSSKDVEPGGKLCVDCQDDDSFIDGEISGPTT